MSKQKIKSSQPRSQPIPLTADGIIDTAKRIGYDLGHHFRWLSKEYKCGCAAGIAAVMRDPSVLDGESPTSEDLTAPGRLTGEELDGLHTGFEGKRKQDTSHFSPEYQHAYAVGRELRDRIGNRTR